MAKKRILVVDDDQDVAMMIKSRLEAHGYDVKTVYSGEECLKILEKDFDPDLVVLDVILPNLNGYEICAEIKSIKARTYPVVMLTSRNLMIDERLGYLCKADAYIHKPLSRELLLPTIEKLLKEAGSSVGK